MDLLQVKNTGCEISCRMVPELGSGVYIWILAFLTEHVSEKVIHSF